MVIVVDRRHVILILVHHLLTAKGSISFWLYSCHIVEPVLSTDWIAAGVEAACAALRIHEWGDDLLLHQLHIEFRHTLIGCASGVLAYIFRRSHDWALELLTQIRCIKCPLMVICPFLLLLGDTVC